MSLSINKNAEIVTVESSSSDSSLSPSPKIINKNKTKNNNTKKMDILFDECHWYDIPCPHPSCYLENVRFDSHSKFKNHHESVHCPRGTNGDINRAKDSLRWKCPVIITRKIDNKEIQEACSKISNSWYNYAGHITSHKEIGHGWGCALKPAGKRKKTNVKRTIYNVKTGKYVKQIVCGKRTSTKHHLLAHMGNVHKQYNVIDTNARQYNKKNGRKKRSKSIKNSRSNNNDLKGKKRKFIDITNGCDDTSLQMPLPYFNKEFNKIHTNNRIPIIPPSVHNIIHNTLPTFPNLFNGNINVHSHSNQVPIFFNYAMEMQTPPLKKMRYNQIEHKLSKTRLIPNSKGHQCNTDDNGKEQFEFLSLLCKAVDTHKGCNKCQLCDDIDDNEIEASLPSLSTCNVSPSTISTNDDTKSSIISNNSNNSINLSLPKLPIIFPNFTSNTITNNVPFTFDLNQLCSNNNKTNTNRINQSNVITTAIPSLPPNIPFKIN